MRDVKLLLFDIDQTLVDDDGMLKEHTKEVLNKLHENGYYLGLSSGRYIQDDLITYAKKWGLSYQFDCIVACNGAHLYDGVHDRIHTYFELSTEEMKEIFAKMQKFDILAHIYYSDITLYSKEDPEVEEARAKYNKPILVAKTIDEMCQRPTPKIMYFTPLENSKEIEEYAKSICVGKSFDVVRTRDFMIEFVPRGCGKGYAMLEFAKLNGFTAKEIIAFGDTSNDNDMLAKSGIGVCLRNGTKDTKVLADIITEKTIREEGAIDCIETCFPELLRD
ncbi:MAG: HAD family phosphatase [Erysipelotrichaceae bacterium]|nr:HAD family phosphatase [Erysipelotrichaceae bacterium]